MKPCRIASLLLLLAMTLLPAWALAEMPTDNKAFANGNKLYREGKYEEATKAYQKLLDEGFAASSLFYNLGNAYVKTGELSKAVLSYERALRENPRDPEVKANLEFTRGLLADRADEGGLQVLLSQISPLQWLSWRENSWGFLVFYWIGVVLGVAGILIRRGKKQILVVTAVLLGITLFLGAMLFFRSPLWADPQAIVMPKEVEVRYGPVLGESAAFTLHEGSKVRVLRSTQEWSQIYFAKGKVGWVPSENLTII